MSENVFLITGGNGFLASSFIDILHSRQPGHQIIVTGRKEFQDKPPKVPGICHVTGDLREKRIWADLPRTITHVFHMAAAIPWRCEDRNKAAIAEENLLPIAHMIECSQKWPSLRQVIFSSSVSVYAKSLQPLTEESAKSPADIYGASKLAGEDLLQCLSSRDVLVSALRYSSIYGNGQYQGTVLPAMMNMALQNNEIHIYATGERTQDFVHVFDAANANWLAYSKRAQGAYNIGSGIAVSMNNLAQAIRRIFTNNAARLISLETEGHQDPGLKLDITKASRELGYQPEISLEMGLELMKQGIERA